eukprot:2676029-Rhodomonas_salina.1
MVLWQVTLVALHRHVYMFLVFVAQVEPIDAHPPDDYQDYAMPRCAEHREDGHAAKITHGHIGGSRHDSGTPDCYHPP